MKKEILLKSVRRAALACAVMALGVCPTRAWAIPHVGDRPPAVSIDDAWERTVDLARLVGRPVLVVYEDQDSATQNTVLKDQLSLLAKGDAYKGKVTLLAVADLQGYDYWPARGFVRDAIKSESVKQKTPIYCDWSGKFRSALGLPRGKSNVVLYGRSGTVLLSHSGAMPDDVRVRLLTLLRSEVGA